MVTLVFIWSNNTSNMSDIRQVVTEIFQHTYPIHDGCRTVGKSPQNNSQPSF